LRVLQNEAAPALIDNRPFLDFFQGAKATEAGKIIVQAAIADAGGLNSAVGITHGSAQLPGIDLITAAEPDPGNASQARPSADDAHTC
jgi:hypothetical protein